MDKAAGSRLQVKNKAPAQTQITAEQIIREAKERELEVIPPPPQQKISDAVELAEYQQRKRKEFEDNIRKARSQHSYYLKYAAWEEKQGEILRARSIFERALDQFSSRDIKIWLAYIEMEKKHKQVNSARNLFDRATRILPFANQLWYKYVEFEQLLGEHAYCRRVFEKWMEYSPGEQGWQTYINFEERRNEIERARKIYIQFLKSDPSPENWIKFARFETRHSKPDNARQVYELALTFFGSQYHHEQLYIAFAKFEEHHNEYDRAKSIYEYAISYLPKAVQLHKEYLEFKKRNAKSQDDIEDSIASNRKHYYEMKLSEDPTDYELWFDYARLAEEHFSDEDVESIYERAIKNEPQDREDKDCWRRYIHLWIYYATFEELRISKEKAFEVFKRILEIIPHKVFTFSKIWLFAAKLLIRMGKVDKARELLDTSLEVCPTRKLFNEYIELEIQLRNFKNCRRLYKNLIKLAPKDGSTWIGYAEFESILCEVEQVRKIYKLALGQDELDDRADVWKAYIDFEKEQGDYNIVVGLYKELLESTNHVKVWISYAQYCAEVGEHGEARAVFSKANEKLVGEDPLARVVLLESWQEFEQSLGDKGMDISKKMPKLVKKRKRNDDDDDYEEYHEYVFPKSDHESSGLLSRAKRFMQQKRNEEG
uniref:Crooked neck-like protein 1 n=1 Tax=Aceria tosichella TaxID=561515 RepID=A0A6G1SF92_9ACAR